MYNTQHKSKLQMYHTVIPTPTTDRRPCYKISHSSKDLNECVMRLGNSPPAALVTMKFFSAQALIPDLPIREVLRLISG